MEITVDGKTISLKHYLNKALNPIWLEEGELGYPVYTQVVFNTKSTRFKAVADPISLADQTIYLPLKFEANLSDETFLRASPKFSRMLQADEKILKIVEWELLQNSQRFSLKGLGRRIARYGENPFLNVTNKIKKDFNNLMADTLTYNQYNELIALDTLQEYLIYVFPIQGISDLFGKRPPHKTILEFGLGLVLEELIISKKNMTYYTWFLEDYRKQFANDIQRIVKNYPMIDNNMNDFKWFASKMDTLFEHYINRG